MYIFVIHIRFNLTMDPVFSFAIFGNTKQEELQLLYQKMSSSPIMKINIAPFDVFIVLAFIFKYSLKGKACYLFLE